MGTISPHSHSPSFLFLLEKGGKKKGLNVALKHNTAYSFLDLEDLCWPWRFFGCGLRRPAYANPDWPLVSSSQPYCRDCPIIRQSRTTPLVSLESSSPSHFLLLQSRVVCPREPALHHLNWSSALWSGGGPCSVANICYLLLICLQRSFGGSKERNQISLLI